jgi:hypothetical protein
MYPVHPVYPVKVSFLPVFRKFSLNASRELGYVIFYICVMKISVGD